MFLIRSEAVLTNTILFSAGSSNCNLVNNGVVTGTGNLDSDNTCGLGAGNLLSIDPLLDPLADNGGPTDTRLLQEGSPAIDAADDGACEPIDQRGIARPQGAGCDIGAVEVEALNEPPNCSAAAANPGILTLPLFQLVPIQIVGVTDPDGDPVTITVTGIRQDESVSELISGLLTAPDGFGVGTSSPQVRAERPLLLLSNGRVYHIYFDASDGNGGSCSGDVTVKVPLIFPAVDNGPSFDSTVP